MPHHVAVRLPDGRMACADWRDDIIRPMREINRAISVEQQPAPALYDRVAAWLDGHAEQSAACHAGLSPSALPCGHD